MFRAIPTPSNEELLAPPPFSRVDDFVDEVFFNAVHRDDRARLFKFSRREELGIVGVESL